jgi:hypothetical protein
MNSSVRSGSGFLEGDSDLLDLGSLGGGESRRGAHTGIRGLMLAILEDGIRSYFSPVTRIRNEAEYWVSNRKLRSPFAFAVICETLGLEPDAVAAALGRLRAAKGISHRPVRRSRPNVRHQGRIHPKRRRQTQLPSSRSSDLKHSVSDKNFT